jgi:aspartyl-tRNA(Asn)/glutamyl-tRNA(Gln) amidotransferase subunit A
MNQDLTFLRISELAPLIRNKSVSPVDVAEAYINRIEKFDPTLNAFITRLDDHARSRAKTAESEITSGLYKGPLHGIPIGLKDLFYTKGIKTTSGSILEKGFIPREDSTAVTKLNEAGAYCIGKLHMTEFAFDGTSRNHHYGPARNPWNISLMAGGSSSGSGVAVASREVPIALGTDTGGSVRVPASLCGITGLKPTFGLISRYGVTALSWSMDHVGILGKSAEDTEIVFNHIAGHDHKDPGSVHQPQIAITDSSLDVINGMRIGIPKEFIWEIMDSNVKSVFQQAILHMESLGAEIVEISIAKLPMVNPAGSIVQTSEASALHRNRILSNADQYDPVIRRRIESGFFIPATSYLQAQRVRYACMEEISKSMTNVDFLATPTTAVTAFPLDKDTVDINGNEVGSREALLRITRIFSTLGMPAISIPCGFTKANLPVGLQLVGKPFYDNALLGLAKSYQLTTEWHKTFPQDLD